jgi:hypothetical protein
MDKQEALQKYPDLQEGMTIRNRDGEKVGILLESRPADFVVEKGFFFPDAFHMPYDEITKIQHGEIYLASSGAHPASWRDEAFGGWSNQTTHELGVPHDQPVEIEDNSQVHELKKKVS